jgi:cobalt-zinc-cadmium efflux system membrane fusion protein
MRGALITDERRDRVVVPNEALEEHTGKPTLYVLRRRKPGNFVARADKPGSFEVRHVKLGVRGPGWREVTEGLEAGEQIAVSGTFYLKSEALKSSLSDACCSAE